MIFLIFISLSLWTISAADNSTNKTLIKPSITSNVDLNDLFQSFGAIIALVLGILKILEFRKNKVSLKINLSQVEFSSMQMNTPSDYNSETIIKIKVDLKNIGLEPTTLTGVDFHSDNKSLNSIKMSNNVSYTQDRIMITKDFISIRIDSNDRKNIDLSILKYIYLPENITEINTKLIFKTTHKDISKKIKLIRKNK